MQPLPPHSHLHLCAEDLIAPSGERECVIVADQAVFDVRQNRSQIQLLGQRPMMVGKIRHWPGEVLIPFRPVFSLQKFIGILER